MSSRLAALVGSVRVRLTFAVSIIFAGALTLASFGLVRQVENALVNDVQVRNDTVAQALGKILSAGNPDALSTSDPTQLADGLSGTYDADMLREGLNESIVYASGPGSATVSQSTNIFDKIRQVISCEAIPLFSKALPSRIDYNDYVVSKVKVPTMLVWMNSPGPWMERSTWLSAAKCRMARGLYWASACRTAA